MKKVIAYAAAAAIIVSAGIYLYDSRNTVRIDKDRIGAIYYCNNDIEYHLSSKSANYNDRINIYNCLNNGKLVPDKNQNAKHVYNNGHININVFGKGGRLINVYREKNDKFVVTYSLSPMSNSERDFRITTIHSKLLEKYFLKWEKET